MANTKLTQITKVLLGIFMGASFSIFSLQQMINYSAVYMILTALGSFCIGLVIGIKALPSQISFVKKDKAINCMILIISVLFIVASYRTKGCVYIPKLNEQMMELGLPEMICSILNFFRLRYYILSIPAVWFILSCIFRVCRNLALDIMDGVSRKERNMYIVITAGLFAVVFVAYSTQQMWYLQYDNVYSIDSGWCFQSIYPNLSYYDIRHPLMSEFTFPIWAVITEVLQAIAPVNLVGVLTAILLQWTNICMLILVGIMLRKITGNIIVFFMYLCSFPTLLFALSFEKYQLCVFLLVLYVYSKCRGKAGANGLLIMTTGLMPTNAVIAVAEFFDEHPLKEKVKSVGQIIITGVAILVCCGRVHLINLWQAFTEIGGMHAGFGSGTLSVSEKINAVFSMIQSSFVALSSVANGRYLWLSVTGKIGVLSALIMAIVLLGMILGRKEKFYKICSVWVLFAFFLFVVLNWAPHETPLFAIIFSWAIIALFVKGLDFIVSKMRIKPIVVYGSIGIVMLAINVATLMDIGKFFG